MIAVDRQERHLPGLAEAFGLAAGPVDVTTGAVRRLTVARCGTATWCVLVAEPVGFSESSSDSGWVFSAKVKPPAPRTAD